MSLSRGAVRLCEVQEETSISSAWSSVATQLVCLFSWLLWLVGMSSRCATHHAQVLLMCDQCGSGISRAMLIWNRDTRHIPPPPRRRPGSVGKYTTCCGGILGGEFEVTCQTCPTGPAPGESVSIPVVGPGPMLYLKVEVLECKEPPSHPGVRVLCLGIHWSGAWSVTRVKRRPQR